MESINSKYEQFYACRTRSKVYPTEFVVRSFLADYPDLKLVKPSQGDRILDMAFGDGRNTLFLCELGLSVSGVEITEGIVRQTSIRLRKQGYEADLRVGRNSEIPFKSNTFKYILASHCIYYCDTGQTLRDNLFEYSRVLEPGGWLVASVACSNSYIFKDAKPQCDGSFIINCDPYGNRNGYRLFAFDNRKHLEEYFSEYFWNFSIGFADNDYFGICEKVFWIVCQNIESRNNSN